MDFENFFTSPRWDMLKIISESPSSPMEISKKLNTTSAYISQQLKLLEIAGIIQKVRTGSVEKGQPRTLFSISGERIYSIFLSEKFAKKGFLELDNKKKLLFNILFVENTKIGKILEEIFWKIGGEIEKIVAIILDESELVPKIIFVYDLKEIQSKLKEIQKEFSKKIVIEIIESRSLNIGNKVPISVLHGSEEIFKREIEMKGGDKK